ncbi:MAG TPA: diguanylate cyclase [Pseudolabrys sp.]|nr:diguanylate cyclase [Pseudolabrys sp.]
MPNERQQRPDPGAARQRRALSIRARLMMLAVFAIVPLLIERIYNEEIDRKEHIEAAYKQALDAARQGTAAQNEAIISARAVLQVVASARETFSASDESCGRFLARIAKPLPWIKVLSVANLQGRIVCSSAPEALGLDISSRPHFYKAVDSGDFVFSDYFMASRLETPVITLALAQRGPNDAAAAVVLGVLDLSWFEQVAMTFVPPSGCMLMIDGNGTILAQYPSRQNLVGQKFKDHPLIREMLARPQGLVTETALDGVRRIFGFIQLPGTQAHIAVGLDEKAILARADREMWTGLAEVGALAALVILGIWFGGERLLVRPLRALAKATSQIGRGEVKTRVTELPLVAELVPLAVALNDMADKLSVREQELRDSNEQLRELAQIDALTGLPNRRTFNERLSEEWKHAAELEQPIAVLMIDVDHFKKFNDHYGHVQGDQCLRKVAGVLMSATRVRTDYSPVIGANLPPSFHRITGCARHADFAARYGGEEFAILLRGADIDTALQVAERLRQGVENLLMAHAGASWGFVSISIGAASVLASEQANPQDLTEAADAALYVAKGQGRNRVTGSVAVTPLSRAS